MARGILLHPGPKQCPSQSRATEPHWSGSRKAPARKLCANLEGCCTQPLGKAQKRPQRQQARWGLLMGRMR